MVVGNVTLPFARFATVNLLPLGQIESWETVTFTPLVARLSTPFIVSVFVGPVLFVITTGEMLLRPKLPAPLNFRLPAGPN
jgi:hypothetical protein